MSYSLKKLDSISFKKALVQKLTMIYYIITKRNCILITKPRIENTNKGDVFKYRIIKRTDFTDEVDSFILTTASNDCINALENKNNI